MDRDTNNLIIIILINNNYFSQDHKCYNNISSNNKYSNSSNYQRDHIEIHHRQLAMVILELKNVKKDRHSNKGITVMEYRMYHL